MSDKALFPLLQNQRHLQRLMGVSRHECHDGETLPSLMGSMSSKPCIIGGGVSARADGALGFSATFLRFLGRSRAKGP
jgi:hypothetical protein